MSKVNNKKKFLLSERIGNFLSENGTAINSIREQADQIDWSVFSSYVNIDEISSYIDEFESEFDIKRYSDVNGVKGLSMEMIKKYQASINWNVVIREKQLTKDELRKFKNNYFDIKSGYMSNPLYSYISRYGCDKDFNKMFNESSDQEKETLFSGIITGQKLSKKNVIEFIDKHIGEDYCYAEEILNNFYINDDILVKYMDHYFSNETPKDANNHIGVLQMNGLDVFLGSYSLKDQIKNKQNIKKVTLLAAEKKSWKKFSWILMSYKSENFHSSFGGSEKVLNFGLDPIEDDDYFSEIINKGYADDALLSDMLGHLQLGKKTLEALLNYSSPKVVQGQNQFPGLSIPSVFSDKKILYNRILTSQELDEDLEKKYIEKYLFISK